jgi:hypothetical protein
LFSNAALLKAASTSGKSLRVFSNSLLVKTNKLQIVSATIVADLRSENNKLTSPKNLWDGILIRLATARTEFQLEFKKLGRILPSFRNGGYYATIVQDGNRSCDDKEHFLSKLSFPHHELARNGKERLEHTDDTLEESLQMGR